MKYYEVHIGNRLTKDVVVSANSEEEAIEKAFEEVNDIPYEDWEFADDDADAWEVSEEESSKSETKDIEAVSKFTFEAIKLRLSNKKHPM